MSWRKGKYTLIHAGDILVMTFDYEYWQGNIEAPDEYSEEGHRFYFNGEELDEKAFVEMVGITADQMRNGKFEDLGVSSDD